jgi:hypothetical protein
MTGAPARPRRGPGGYLRDHWRGRQSLAWSFWVNLVLLRAAILGLDRFTRPPFLEDPDAVAVATVAFFVVFHLIVFVWQVVGVVRACDAYQRDFGASGVTLITYVGIAGAVALTFTSASGAFVLLFQEPEGEPEYLAWERERAARYSLARDAEDPTLLRFSGTFELGVTKRLRALLERNSGIRALVLDSPGGHVYAGRGVATLVQRHDLDTFVVGQCNSACTTAFIAGETRVLAPGGRLGFHQHRMDADYPVYLVDEEAEMEKDLAFYRAQGIAEDFREKVFETPHDGLWFPSHEALLAAGVVHRIGLPD